MLPITIISRRHVFSTSDTQVMNRIYIQIQRVSTSVLVTSLSYPYMHTDVTRFPYIQANLFENIKYSARSIQTFNATGDWDPTKNRKIDQHGLLNKRQGKDINYQILHNVENWHKLLMVFEQYGEKFNGINWSTFMNRLGRAHKKDIIRLQKDKRYNKVISSITKIFTSSNIRNMFSVQAVANIVHALAKINEPIPIILDIVEAESEWLINNGTAQNISNIAWAFATLSIPAPKFFGLIDKKSSQMINNANPQNISNIAWAFATLSIPAPLFFSEIEKLSPRLVKEGTAQGVSNIAWAFATLSIPAPHFFSLVDKYSSQMINNANPQSISNIAWAFATLSIPAPLFFSEIEKHSSWLVKYGTAQNISNTVWSYSQLGLDGPKLLNLIDTNSPRLIKQMNSQNTSNTALAFAKLGFKTDYFFNELENNVEMFITYVNTQSICNILWSLAILDLMNRNKNLLHFLWKEVILTDPSEFNDEQLSQLAQVCLYAKASSTELNLLPVSLQSRIENSCWLHKNMHSRSEKEYAQLLLDIGFNHKREESPCDDNNYGTMLTIDYACKDRMIAIEFDGAPHFLTDLKNGALPNYGKKNGPTMAKRRLLQGLGWKVVSIPYMHDIEMNKRGGNKIREVKKQYLRLRLSRVDIDL